MFGIRKIFYDSSGPTGRTSVVHRPARGANMRPIQNFELNGLVTIQESTCPHSMRERVRAYGCILSVCFFPSFIASFLFSFLASTLFPFFVFYGSFILLFNFLDFIFLLFFIYSSFFHISISFLLSCFFFL